MIYYERGVARLTHQHSDWFWCSHSLIRCQFILISSCIDFIWLWPNNAVCSKPLVKICSIFRHKFFPLIAMLQIQQNSITQRRELVFFSIYEHNFCCCCISSRFIVWHQIEKKQIEIQTQMTFDCQIGECVCNAIIWIRSNEEYVCYAWLLLLFDVVFAGINLVLSAYVLCSVNRICVQIINRIIIRQAN